MILAAAAALAANSTIASDRPPPLRFQRDARTRIEFVQPQLIDERCKDFNAPAGTVRLACTHVRPLGPVVTVPNPCLVQEPYAQLLCHELGHVNGWPATHGD